MTQERRTRSRRLAAGVPVPVRMVLARMVLAHTVLACPLPPAAASPLDKQNCEALKSEETQLAAVGVRADMQRGPVWAKANLAPERLAQIRRLIEVEEQVKFRCILARPPAGPKPAASSQDTPALPSPASPDTPGAGAAIAPDNGAGGPATPARMMAPPAVAVIAPVPARTMTAVRALPVKPVAVTVRNGFAGPKPNAKAKAPRRSRRQPPSPGGAGSFLFP